MNISARLLILSSLLSAYMLAGAAIAADRNGALAYLSAVMPDDAIVANLPSEAGIVQALKNTGEFPNVPDSDLQELSIDFLRLYTPLYVPRLRDAFVDHFVETFSDEDLEKMTACNVGGDCSAARADADLVARAQNLASFGQVAGSRIGSQVGKEITPELIDLVQANDGGRFEQTEAVIAGLKAGAAQ